MEALVRDDIGRRAGKGDEVVMCCAEYALCRSWLIFKSGGVRFGFGAAIKRLDLHTRAVRLAYDSKGWDTKLSGIFPNGTSD